MVLLGSARVATACLLPAHVAAKRLENMALGTSDSAAVRETEQNEGRHHEWWAVQQPDGKVVLPHAGFRLAKEGLHAAQRWLKEQVTGCSGSGSGSGSGSELGGVAHTTPAHGACGSWPLPICSFLWAVAPHCTQVPCFCLLQKTASSMHGRPERILKTEQGERDVLPPCAFARSLSRCWGLARPGCHPGPQFMCGAP